MEINEWDNRLMHIYNSYGNEKEEEGGLPEIEVRHYHSGQN